MLAEFTRFFRNKVRNALLLADLAILLVMTIISARLIWPRYISWGKTLIYWGMLAILFVVFMLLLKTHKQLWRYSEKTELFGMMNAYALTCITALFINHIFSGDVPVRITLFSVIGSEMISCYLRTVFRKLYNARSRRAGGEQSENKGRRPIAIIGAGSAGVMLMHEISRNKESPYVVWGFFDDDENKIGLSIDRVPVRGNIESIPEKIKSSDVHDIVLAIPSLGPERRREIIDICKNLNSRLKIMPDIVMAMEDGTDKLVRSIRDIKVEDLLGRRSIVFTDNEIKDFIRDKTILVTGAGGSIGSELCRQIASAKAKAVIIFDINENSSYLLQNEIHDQIDDDIRVYVEIGSVTDIRRVEDVFGKYRPDVVFHAAAHKHVPLMEQCPYEAVKNNILGTKNVITTASSVDVEKFVFISTDKAVNPSSVMGATKRYGEDMIRALSRQPFNRTCFVSVRFGNVLGSAGSVIPIFQDQIARSGPVTITDKRATRYFMTIPEAVGLVLKAGAMASSSETYILDMGEPMKIIDLAENMIRLLKMEPYKDIPIIEIGLRPGEKLHEELLVSDEKHIATKESKIFVEKNNTNVNWSTVVRQLDEFGAAVSNGDNERIRQLLHRYVPGYHNADTADNESDAKVAVRRSDLPRELGREIIRVG